MNRVPSLEYVSVSKDAYDFLKHMLFGAWNSIYVASSERAYRDMCRTLRNIRQSDANSTKLRSEIDQLLEREICALFERGIANQDQYDEWHEKMCVLIRKHYRDNSFDMTIGQAQKWVNMTMKYLFVADVSGTADAFYFCHVPIDSYICITTHRTREMLPFVKNNIKILNVDTGEELGFGQEGEVCVTGPSLMLGYYKHPEATEELFFEADGIRWMRTGDLGMVTEKGFFHITGRIKRIFWKMGDDDIVYRVYPMKIEEVICQCEAVAHCAVVGRKNTAKGYDPIAFVVKKNDEQAEHDILSSIKENCKQHLQVNSQPTEIHFIESLPMTRAGKIDYRALEKEAENT